MALQDTLIKKLEYQIFTWLKKSMAPLDDRVCCITLPIEIGY